MRISFLLLSPAPSQLSSCLRNFHHRKWIVVPIEDVKGRYAIFIHLAVCCDALIIDFVFMDSSVITTVFTTPLSMIISQIKCTLEIYISLLLWCQQHFNLNSKSLSMHYVPSALDFMQWFWNFFLDRLPQMMPNLRNDSQIF